MLLQELCSQPATWVAVPNTAASVAVQSPLPGSPPCPATPLAGTLEIKSLAFIIHSLWLNWGPGIQKGTRLGPQASLRPQCVTHGESLGVDNSLSATGFLANLITLAFSPWTCFLAFCWICCGFTCLGPVPTLHPYNQAGFLQGLGPWSLFPGDISKDTLRRATCFPLFIYEAACPRHSFYYQQTQDLY